MLINRTITFCPTNMFRMGISIIDSEANKGTTIWPFMSFMMFFVGIIGFFIGIVILSEARRQWHVFYSESHHTKEEELAIKKKNMIKGFTVSGMSMLIFIISFFVK